MWTPTTVEVSDSEAGVGVTLRLMAGPRRTGVPDAPLPVAFVALATLDLPLGLFSAIGHERLAHIVGLLEFASGAASDKSLVSSGIDQLTLPGLFPTRCSSLSPFSPSCPLPPERAISVPVDELGSP
jgi:hypothetical protein